MHQMTVNIDQTSPVKALNDMGIPDFFRIMFVTSETYSENRVGSQA